MPLQAFARGKTRNSDVRLFIGFHQAQQLYFANTEHGDVCDLFSGHYDTTSGSKREADSYRSVARSIGVAPNHIWFLSDITAECDAAVAAGMHAIWVVRDNDVVTRGNVDDCAYPVVTSFDMIPRLIPGLLGHA